MAPIFGITNLSTKKGFYTVILRGHDNEINLSTWGQKGQGHISTFGESETSSWCGVPM